MSTTSLSGELFWTEPWMHGQIEAIKLAFADRFAYAQDPQPATRRSKRCSATPGRSSGQSRSVSATTTVTPGAFQAGDTTYICIVDGNGMMVSLIQSVSNAFGSGVIAGDTGVVMNNRVGRGFTLDPSHPNVYAPGKRTMHTLNCFSIEQLDGTPVLVGGTPGGDGQPQWNLAMVTALIDGDLDVQQTVEMPRWNVWPGTDPTGVGNPFELRLEREFGPDLYEKLAARGHVIRPYQDGTVRPSSLRATRIRVSWWVAAIPGSRDKPSASERGADVTFAERLAAQVGRTKSLVCVGLDPDPTRFPEQLRKSGRREAIVAFNRAIVEATADLVCAYKPNLGFMWPRALMASRRCWKRAR